jgi:hypothetical protein
MSIRVGSKPIEFEKGKAGVAVPTLDKLAGVIDTLIKAIQSGELDEQLTLSRKLTKTAAIGTRKVA